MGSLNEVTILGNITKAIETRATNGGKTVATLNIATNESYTNNAGEKVETPAFHRVTAFGAQADSAAKYLTVGQQVLIKGKLSYSSFDDKDNPGKKIYKTDIIALQVIFLGKPGGKSDTPFKAAPFAGNKAKPAAQSQDDNDFGGSDDDQSIPF